jgi:small neutral amino acid transporter SnatA (MarC family)
MKHEAGPIWERRIFPVCSMFAICLLVLIYYSRADRLVRMLGKSGMTILERLSAFILLAIGMQIIWDGLKAGIPQLSQVFDNLQLVLLRFISLPASVRRHRW